MRLLLQTCPNPYHLRDLGPAGIRQLFSDHGQRCGPVTANRIYAIAQQSLLPSADVCALLTAQAQADFLQYCWFEDQVAAYEARATALLPATFGQVLTTLPGVSPRMAARYLAGIGDPDRFTSARQIWAYAGFDPTQADSGNHRYTGGISHRGSPSSVLRSSKSVILPPCTAPTAPACTCRRASVASTTPLPPSMPPIRPIGSSLPCSGRSSPTAPLVPRTGGPMAAHH
ncbi:MAG: IS110 family transposase [Anaerolineae bacterium]|nr:MAG: IS110 family transposase [Anaerolineae bacterium]